MCLQDSVQKLPKGLHWRNRTEFRGSHEKHRKEVDQQEGRKYTRSTKRQSQSEQNKSAITDHVNTENHVINWDEAKVIARESDRITRWIREAVKIRKESQGVMNRDEGAYQLSHIYDKLLLPSRTSSLECHDV